MKSTSASFIPPVAQCIPFAQATSEQLAQAERSVQDTLKERFPPGTWANALRALQPNLWVTPETVSLDPQDLVRVAQYQQSLKEDAIAQDAPRPRKSSYTRRPMNCPKEILCALAELEANPQAAGPAVYHLVTDAARHHAKVLLFYAAEVLFPREDDGSDPDEARAALLARVDALDRARDVLGAA